MPANAGSAVVVPQRTVPLQSIFFGFIHKTAYIHIQEMAPAVSSRSIIYSLDAVG